MHQQFHLASLIEKVRTGSVLAPLIALLLIIGCFALSFSAALPLHGSSSLMWSLWALFALCVLVALTAFGLFALYAPDRLQTEEYRLQRHRLDMIGDERDPNNEQLIDQYLFASSEIIAFWNYVPLVYCAKSRLSAVELARNLLPFFPHGLFLVAEINPRNLDGMLPRAAWDWFYLDHHEKLRPPALRAPEWKSLGELLSGAAGSSPTPPPPSPGGLFSTLFRPPKK
jgi:hypothetical protein